MDELDGQAYGVAQAWNSTFSLYGVDSTNFSAFSEGYAYKLNDFKFDIAVGIAATNPLQITVEEESSNMIDKSIKIHSLLV